MKKLLIGLTFLAAISSFANCKYNIESKSHQTGEIKKIMFEKGYEFFDSPTTDLLLKISTNTEVLTFTENTFTVLVDLVDKDNESDYIIKYKRVANVELQVNDGSSDVIFSNTKSESSRTLDYFNNFEQRSSKLEMSLAADAISLLVKCQR